MQQHIDGAAIKGSSISAVVLVVSKYLKALGTVSLDPSLILDAFVAWNVKCLS